MSLERINHDIGLHGKMRGYSCFKWRKEPDYTVIARRKNRVGELSEDAALWDILQGNGGVTFPQGQEPQKCSISDKELIIKVPAKTVQLVTDRLDQLGFPKEK